MKINTKQKKDIYRELEFGSYRVWLTSDELSLYHVSMTHKIF
jgi:hypothetical protein